MPAVALATCATLLTPAAAHAESGYRVCFVSNISGHKGLAAKIAKDNGGDTCSKKIAWMKANFSRAFRSDRLVKSDPRRLEWRMKTCESFAFIASRIRGEDWCLRNSMVVNKIYRYDSEMNTWTFFSN